MTRVRVIMGRKTTKQDFEEEVFEVPIFTDDSLLSSEQVLGDQTSIGDQTSTSTSTSTSTDINDLYNVLFEQLEEWSKVDDRLRWVDVADLLIPVHNLSLLIENDREINKFLDEVAQTLDKYYTYNKDKNILSRNILYNRIANKINTYYI